MLLRDLWLTFQQKHCRPEGKELYIQRDEKKELKPIILYPARLSFRIEREIKSVINKQKLKEFSTTKPDL